MSELVFAAATGLPFAAGWTVHAVRLTRRIEAARRDPLSGLLTREPFEKRAARLLRSGPCAVVVVDLDGFKAVNDRFGHAAGDAAIRAAGSGLTEIVDGGRRGLAARLGGDEFAVAAPVANAVELRWLLGGLEGALTAPFRHAGRDLVVGASIGAALSSDLPPGPGSTGRDGLALLLRLADEAMYEAKRSGGGWHYPAATTRRHTTTGGRRTGRPGTHTPGREEAA